MTVALALQSLGPAEIVEATIAYHLAAGVGLVLVPEADVGASVVVEQRTAGRTVRSLLTNERPDQVAADYGAEWLIRGRAGDVWWPRGAPLDELLAAAPRDVDAVQALERRFIPVIGDQPYFERTTLRRVPPALALDPPRSSDPPQRLIRRLGDFPGSRGALRGWFPVEVLSFPAVDGPAVEGTDDVVVEDTRVRDALRKVVAGEPLVFPRPTVADDPHFPVEVAALIEAEVVAAGRRIDELERRLARLEDSRLGHRLRAGLRRAVGRGTGRGPQ